MSVNSSKVLAFSTSMIQAKACSAYLDAAATCFLKIRFQVLKPVIDGQGLMSIFSSTTLPFGKCNIPSFLKCSPAVVGSEASRPATFGRCEESLGVLGG